MKCWFRAGDLARIYMMSELSGQPYGPIVNEAGGVESSNYELRAEVGVTNANAASGIDGPEQDN